MREFMSIVLLMLAVTSTQAQLSQPALQQVKQEIMAVEKAFEESLNQAGAAAAFKQFAAPQAVIKRERDTLVRGPEGIFNYYNQPSYTGATATWKPDWIDVSDDGTMAYTYGNYRWLFPGQAGKLVAYTGVFHTVWKRQADGSWKYVWD